MVNIFSLVWVDVLPDEIPVVEETKFLGLYFDRKLKFLSHIKYVKNKCLKALDILRVVAHLDWGADRAVLLQLYQTLVRSKLDYGCIVYDSTRFSYLKVLDPIQNHGLRLCLSAFRTSPADSLAVEADELPLPIRRDKLALQYIYMYKVAACPENPVHSIIFEPKCGRLFETKPRSIATFGIR